MDRKWLNLTTNTLKRFWQRPQPPEKAKTTLEEAKEIINLAEQFDKTIFDPGFEKLLAFMGQQINNELLGATEKPFEPEMQRVHVVRWDAKRDLLDSALAYVESIRKSRDEIVEQFRSRPEESHEQQQYNTD